MKDLQLNLMIPKNTPILKTFVNSSNIPIIAPLLVNNKFAIDFLGKVNLFNDFFKEQCRPITNGSSIPNNHINGTVIRLSDFNIDNDTIIELIHLIGSKESSRLRWNLNMHVKVVHK